MKKIDNETKKAIIQLPKEVNKLTRVIAVIGETLFNTKAKKLKKNKREFEELVNRKGVT